MGALGVNNIDQVSLWPDVMIGFLVYAQNSLPTTLLCFKEIPLTVLRTVWRHTPKSAVVGQTFQRHHTALGILMMLPGITASLFHHLLVTKPVMDNLYP